MSKNSKSMAKNNNTLAALPGSTAFFPEVSVAEYAKGTGLTVDTVRGHIRLGHIPTIKRGKYRMVNMVALLNECQTAAQDFAKTSIR